MSDIDNQFASMPGRADAARRLGDALLRSFGGTEVTLRIPAPSSGDDKSQLGLEAPAAQDLPISPAVVKPLPAAENGGRRVEVLFSATAVKSIAKDYGVQDVVDWLLAVQGIVHHDRLLRVAAVTVDKFLGADCLYHLTATE